MLRRPQSELCTRGGGLVEDLLCEIDSRTLVDLHLRRTTYRRAVDAGLLRLEGLPELQRRFAHWFRSSPFADYMPQPGVPRAASAPADRHLTPSNEVPGRTGRSHNASPSSG